MTKAEEVFGFGGYAGFDIVLREASQDCGVALNEHNYNKYKFHILKATYKARPNIDTSVLADIIKEIIGVIYAPEEINWFEEYIDSIIH